MREDAQREENSFLCNFTMRKTVSLCDNRRFLQLYRKGKCRVTDSFVLYYKPNGSKENRLGITVGKKTVGNAVKRNRAKRVIREAYGAHEPRLKSGYDFVVASRSKTPFLGTKDVYGDMAYAFSRENLFKEDLKK